MAKTKVIFVSPHNSARSQMAEAFLSKMAGDQFEVYSGGYEPLPIHPCTFSVMEEIGYDLSGKRSKDLWNLIKSQHFGIIITVCRKTEPKCPIVPGVSTRLNWDIEDPVAFVGTKTEKIEKFREVRDQILQQVQYLINQRRLAVLNC